MKTVITVSLDKELLKKFDEVAKLDCRTRTGMIVKLMAETIEKSNAKQKEV